MLTEPFLTATNILTKIESYGYQAYFVGGCVRDYLLGRPIGDVDIATSAKPEMIQQIFNKVIPVGIEHGTVVVRYEQESYEVTTFRIDGIYSDNRRPDEVEFVNKIDEDLARRDFTINALAMSKNGHIIDLFEGRRDLKNKVIRTVGNGYERFSEDPLRIIRALRFTSQLGFTLAPETLVDMKEASHLVNTLAVERLTNEFSKLFAGNDIRKAVTYMKEIQVDSYLPVFRSFPSLIKKLPSNMHSLMDFGEVIAYMHIVEPSVSISVWVKEWKCSNRTKKDAIHLVNSYHVFKKHGINSMLIYQLKRPYLAPFFRVVTLADPKVSISMEKLLTINEKLPIQSKTELSINGQEIIDLFPLRRRGPWIREIMDSLEKEIVLGNLRNNNKEIKEWIRWNPPETN
ncbi:CCA tRNA nucleotidyltransferase [Virgibacillus sp. SK37]|uniref:CCA tRNA nucleotidyltransferase n=1 Tax=Virgibacillus sp. SK37 TaxID=403957 RepID=UPI0004D18345|nr:CCA tRNA nucleotidyltransferase [Virgibacillus sp. SK37]AIF43588.1 poly(A) polymerase [Virgibacillus sp. SK37]